MLYDTNSDSYRNQLLPVELEALITRRLAQLGEGTPTEADLGLK